MQRGRIVLRILLINSNPPPLGGAEYHVELLKELLESKGHFITCFYPYSHYSESSMTDVKKAFLNLIKTDNFDVAHIHDLESRFISIIDILKDNNIKTVLTLHNYYYLCASGSFFRDGKICEECCEGKYYRAAFNGCYSFLHAISRYVRETVFKGDPYRIKNVSHYISPSLFLANVFKKDGFPQEVTHLYNFLDLKKYQTQVKPSSDNPYILFFGRLAEDKGLMTLLSAVQGTGIKLYIVGKGGLEKQIQDRIENESGLSNVELTGFKRGQELFDLIGGSLFTIVPSEWWENLPFTVLESFALGKACIASNLGGITEMVTSDRGVLFEAGDHLDLREKIVNLYRDIEKTEIMGVAGREYVLENMSPDFYYERIMDIYSK